MRIQLGKQMFSFSICSNMKELFGNLSASRPIVNFLYSLHSSQFRDQSQSICGWLVQSAMSDKTENQRQLNLFMRYSNIQGDNSPYCNCQIDAPTIS